MPGLACDCPFASATSSGGGGEAGSKAVRSKFTCVESGGARPFLQYQPDGLIGESGLGYGVAATDTTEDSTAFNVGELYPRIDRSNGA